LDLSTFKKGLKYTFLSAFALLLLATLSAAIYRSWARWQISESRALRAPGAIDRLERVSVGGIDQWIEIRGQSDNPILLFLHGGPGSAFMPVARRFQDPWEKYFMVVQWDQRGAGKTFTANDKNRVRPTMSVARMEADTLEMVNYLRERFARDKIFVLGHSWGSILGLRLAHDHPELLYAYIGVGQATNAIENEVVLYRDTLAQARATNNAKALRELAAIAPYPSANISFRQVRTVREWSNALLGPASNGESQLGLGTIFLAPEYSLIDSLNWIRGQLFSVETLLPGMSKLDFKELGYDYRVPVFFLEGRHDPYTPSSVAEQFFEKMSNPQKRFVWFENSGHYPFIEEPQKFTDILTREVLPLVHYPPSKDAANPR
jgi:proline iminopeptidase